MEPNLPDSGRVKRPGHPPPSPVIAVDELEHVNQEEAKSRAKMVYYKGWSWPANKKFEIEKLIGKMVAVGEVPGRTNIKAGTVLYKVLWKGYPPKIATWEEESAIHDDFIDEDVVRHVPPGLHDSHHSCIYLMLRPDDHDAVCRATYSRA